MKASYSELPETVELMPDGYTKFRFDIQEETDGENTQFICREVDVRGGLSSDKVIALAIADKWGNGVEQKLINDYNEYLISQENEEAQTAYFIFLAERKALKTYIKSVLA